MKEKVPQLRFPEFKTDLMSSDLRDLANNIASGSIKSKDKGKYDVHGSTGIIGKSDEYSHQGSYLLIARVGANAGTINKVSGKFAVTDNTLVVDINDQINITFLYNYLENYDLNRHIFGSGQPLITGTILKNLNIVYPNLEEQKKIAGFLSSVDQKIQQLRQKKELLDEYKKSVMQKLFPSADGQAPEIRFKDDNGEDFPDWEIKELGNISDRIADKNEDEKYDFVLTNSAVQGVVSQTEYFDKSIANKSNLGGYYIVKIDDFVYNPRISSEAPVGPIKRNKLKTGVMSPLYSVFRIKEKNLDFFEYFFETTLWHRYMHSVANFGARHDRMNITVGDFQKLPIPVPSEEERTKITDFINLVSKKQKAVNRKLELAEKFKKGLLQQMFV